MRLYTFEHDGRARIGAEVNGHLVDLRFASTYLIRQEGPFEESPQPLPPDMLGLIRAGDRAFRLAQKASTLALKRLALPVGERLMFSFDEVHLHAPLFGSGKIVCVEKHRAAQLPEVFIKVASAIIGTDQRIALGNVTSINIAPSIAAIVGKPLAQANLEQASAGIFGYTLLSDAQPLSVDSSQLTFARNQDTFCQIGPCIVTADEVEALKTITATAAINGRQIVTATHNDFLRQHAEALSSFSKTMSFRRGDVISIPCLEVDTSLKSGDAFTFEVAGLGRLQNPVA